MSTGYKNHFLEIVPGTEVTFEGRAYRVSHVISLDSVLAVDIATGLSKRLSVESLKLAPKPAEDGSIEPDEKDLMLHSKEEWAEAQRKFQAIKPLLEQPFRSREEVEVLAKKHGVHVATLYRWLSVYTDSGHVAALVSGKRGRKYGSTMLSEPMEKLIEAAIDDVYLDKQRGSPQSVIDEVDRRCRLAKLPSPHPNTVRNRIARIPDRIVLRRRGRSDEARNRFEPVRGKFPGATHPLAVVQIDHTPLDIVCVDEVHRKPVARPFLTLAIDVYSRMVVGFYLSYDPPSAASVGMCLSQAMCPKREYLAELGVAGSWPVWGRIGKVHCDNAKEFRGAMLKRACEDEHIDLEMRPVKRPHYGGHIERLMGTVATEMHKLPGTTFANPQDRKGYDSDKEATFTLRELEAYLAEFFVNVYHQRVHGGLGMAPIHKWQKGLVGDATTPGIGLIAIPTDPERLRLNFMPYFERTVQPYGIQIDNIGYYDPVLDRFINSLEPQDPKTKNRVKRKFIVRRDPKDVSKVHFFDPEASRYVPIPYRDLSHPAMSLFELKEVLKLLASEGQTDVDEGLIFEALERMRQRVETATHKSKAARKHAARSAPAQGKRDAPSQATPEAASPPASPSAPSAPRSQSSDVGTGGRSTEEIDPFAEPIVPFEDLGMRR